MIIRGDSLEVLKTFDADSVDACVTDPPYGLVFMNKHWDAQVPSVELWREVFRVLKPGAHLLSFGGTRTYHRMAVAIEDAGFEIRDQLQWLYGSGFPKSSRVNRDQTFCQCASSVRNGVSTSLSRPQVDHTDTEAGASGDGLLQLDELHCSDIEKGFPDGCRQDHGSGDELLQADESLDQASIPLQECVRVRNRSVVLGDDQADESSRNLSSAQCSVHPSSQNYLTRSEFDVDISRGTPSSKERSANTSTRTNSVLSVSRKSRTTSQSSASHKIDSSISKCQECGNPVADGLGTALKPANEPIVLARKPLAEKTVARNVLRYGTGALNIDASRIGTELVPSKKCIGDKYAGFKGETQGENLPWTYTAGRWPSNVILACDCGDDEGQIPLLHRDDCAVGELDRQSLAGGMHGAGKARPKQSHVGDFGVGDHGERVRQADHRLGDTGGASRFFYVAKTSRRERNAGLEGMPERVLATSNHGQETSISGRLGADPLARQTPVANHHPTVKPIKLMEYLIRLITPPGGTVLDCFAGSGSTGVAAIGLGYQFIGIEREAEYADIAEKRIEHVALKACEK